MKEQGRETGEGKEGNVSKNIFCRKRFQLGVLKQGYFKVLSTIRPIGNQPALKMSNMLKYLTGAYHNVSLTIFLSLYT